MSKLSEALGDRTFYIHNDNNETEASRREYIDTVVIPAQQELLELQRLQSTVKEFIAHEGLHCREDIYDAVEQDSCPVDFIESLCNIVGYSE